jgi:hypothetical protein
MTWKQPPVVADWEKDTDSEQYLAQETSRMQLSAVDSPEPQAGITMPKEDANFDE